MKKANYLLMLLLLSLSSPVKASDIPENINTILTGYAKNLDQIKSYVIKLEMETTFNVKISDPPYGPYKGTWKEYNMQDFRTDGNKYHVKGWRWGEERRKREEIKKDKAIYNSLLYNGDKTYQNNYSSAYPQKPDRLIIYPEGTERSKTIQKETLCGGIRCCQAFGYFNGDLNTRIDKLLKGADVKIQIQNKNVNVNGHSCRLITADTSHGTYKLWFAPENGYSIIKAIKTVKEGDIFNGHPEPKGSFGIHMFEVAKLKEINGVWIPTEIHYNSKGTHANGDWSYTKHIYKINTFELNPNHESLKSFDLDDVRDGVVAFIYDKKDVEYIWKNGNFIPKGK